MESAITFLRDRNVPGKLLNQVFALLLYILPGTRQVLRVILNIIFITVSCSWFMWFLGTGNTAPLV